MPKTKKRKSTSNAKSDKLWIDETLKRLRMLQQSREPKPAAGSKKANRRSSRDRS
jgi:hypothetical protein